MRPHETKTASAPLAAGDSANPMTAPYRKVPVMFHGGLATTAQVIFIVVAVIALAYVARSVVLPVLIAWVVCMTLKPLVRWLHACRIPTPAGAALVVGLGVAVLGLGVMHMGQPALDWLQSAPENVPRLKEKFQHILSPAIRLSEAASTVGALDPADATARKPQTVEVRDNHVSATVFTWTGSLLTGIGETVALVFLLLATGDLFIHKLVRLMPTLHDKKRALEISHEIQQHISRYLFSVGLVNVAFGIVVGVGFHLVGLPNATMWGGVAALVNFIPYFGPVVGMIAVALAGLFAFDTLGAALAPAGVYLVLHLVEANAITPFVLGRRFTLNPVIIFVALIFCIWLWGVTGALLAVPLLVTLKVISERIPALATVADFLSNQEAAPKNSP